MLRQSFAHLPGIGTTTELRLWDAGFSDWDALLAGITKAPIGSADRDEVQRGLEDSLAALESGDSGYFRKALGLKDAWRAYDEYRDSCAYLDIETDGGQNPNSISLIGIYDGREFVALVKDRDLDRFPELIAPFKMVVTFYGAGFDLPVLQRRFRDVPFEQVHYDLCPTMKRIGYQGGLKRIERTLGIERAPETVGLTGYDAIKLWNRYYHLDDEAALSRLIAYNREDVVNLVRLAEHAYERMRVHTLMGTKPEAAVS